MPNLSSLSSSVAIAAVLFPLCAWGQLTSQPMVGHVGLTDARIWVQVEEETKVQIEYWPDSLGMEPAETELTGHVLMKEERG